jgi:hypothetical protein
MTSKKEKKLVISLIKDDLVNRKLLIGLDDLGLRPTDYYLNLSDTIFSLMGFSDDQSSERIFKHYLNLTEKAKFLNISESQTQLDILAQEIYLELTVHSSTLNK